MSAKMQVLEKFTRENNAKLQALRDIQKKTEVNQPKYYTIRLKRNTIKFSNNRT